MSENFEAPTIKDSTRVSDSGLEPSAMRDADSTEVTNFIDQDYLKAAGQSLIIQGLISPFTLESDMSMNFPKWNVNNASNFYADTNLIAQNYDGRPTTLIPDIGQIWNSSERPLSGQEKHLMAETTKTNPRAWEDAAAAFPQLKDIPVNLMQAYTLNELNFYGREDLAQDVLAAQGTNFGNFTLGMSQITARGVGEFENRYPQLKEFLSEKGYKGKGHEQKALLNPECVPMIVAAKTASIVDDLKSHKIPVTAESVAYGYNPDVYSYNNGNGGRTYKALYQGEVTASNLQHWDQKKEYYADKSEIIAASKHIKNVMSHIHEF